jgi:hypothetical protein
MTKANSTELIFIVDRSGSMESIAADMRGGFDNFIRKQREIPGECRVTVVHFDDRYEVAFTSLALAAVPQLELVPRGMTALLDAMCRAIDETGARLAAMPERERPEKVIVMTITDGLENASRTHKRHDVLDRIRRQERDYNWQFIFLGANQDAIAVARDLGIRAGNAATYQPSAVGMDALFTSASANIGAVRGGELLMHGSLLDQNAYNAALVDAAAKNPAPAWPTVIPASPVLVPVPDAGTPDSSSSKP